MGIHLALEAAVVVEFLPLVVLMTEEIQQVVDQDLAVSPIQGAVVPYGYQQVAVGHGSLVMAVLGSSHKNIQLNFVETQTYNCAVFSF